MKKADLMIVMRFLTSSLISRMPYTSFSKFRVSLLGICQLALGVFSMDFEILVKMVENQSVT